MQYFNTLKQNDVLYAVHFLTLNDIYQIISELGIKIKNVKIYPVGKYKKHLKLIAQGRTSAQTIKNCIEKQKFNTLFTSEKLLCIVENLE